MGSRLRAVAVAGTVCLHEDGTEIALDAGEVFSEEFTNPSARNFPKHLLDRPISGEVQLYVDDELIGVQIPLLDEEGLG